MSHATSQITSATTTKRQDTPAAEAALLSIVRIVWERATWRCGRVHRRINIM
jgi:hypothetical protein